MTVHWTETALGDLLAIQAYFARRSPQCARGLLERLFYRGESLARCPALGPAMAGYQIQGLREVFESPYRLIYRVVGERVEILTIVHAARRLPKRLGENP